MALVLIAGPGAEPLTLDEVKMHLRVDGNTEDALITSLILTSRLHIEAALGLALMTQSWKLVLDAWPADGLVPLPIAPVAAVTETRILAADGTPDTLPPGSFILDSSRRPARLAPSEGQWPPPGRRYAGIEIDLTAGFGTAPDDVPQPIRQALLLLIAHWYEHRDPVEIGAPATAVPHAVSRLLNPYRPVRL